MRATSAALLLHLTPVSRRTLVVMVSIAAGGLISAVVRLQIAGFQLAPLIRKQLHVWRDVGPLDKFEVGHTQKVTLEDSSAIAWGGSDSETAAWLRRAGEESFVAFARNRFV